MSQRMQVLLQIWRGTACQAPERCTWRLTNLIVGVRMWLSNVAFRRRVAHRRSPAKTGHEGKKEKSSPTTRGWKVLRQFSVIVGKQLFIVMERLIMRRGLGRDLQQNKIIQKSCIRTSDTSRELTLITSFITLSCSWQRIKSLLCTDTALQDNFASGFSQHYFWKRNSNVILGAAKKSPLAWPKHFIYIDISSTLPNVKSGHSLWDSRLGWQRLFGGMSIGSLDWNMPRSYAQPNSSDCANKW